MAHKELMISENKAMNLKNIQHQKVFAVYFCIRYLSLE